MVVPRLNKLFYDFTQAKEEYQAHTLSKILFSLICVAAVAVLFMRIPYGADVTDEAFWIAEPYLLTQGAVPFVDNWSQTPLSFLLIAPLVKFFTAVTGGTEGIMLLMFRVAFIFRLSIPLLMWFLLRKRIDPSWAAVFCLLFFICDYGFNRYLNYNSMSQALLALGGALLWNALGQEDPRAAAARYAWAGLVMALCALAHVAQLVNCLLFALFLLVLERRHLGKLPCWLPYALAGLTVAAAVVIGLEWAGGGGLFAGLRLDLAENNYFRISHHTPGWYLSQLKLFFQLCKSIARRSVPAFAVVLAVCLVHFRRKGMKTYSSGLMVSLAGSGVFYCLILARRYAVAFRNAISGGGDHTAYLLLFLCAAVWFILLPREDRRLFLPGFLFFWVSDLVTLSLSVTVSHSAISGRLYFLACGAAFSLPLAAAVLKARVSPGLSTRSRTILLLCLAASLAAFFITAQYAYVYRDEPILALTHRVESGVYKGIYTTPERAEALQTLEAQIRQRTSPEETVLFADLMPTAYLMTDARYCTPTSWDPCHYRYGYQDDILYQSYFEKMGCVPDKIFFIQSEERPLSIDDPENDFASWVREHYTLAERVGEGRFSFRLFTKKT